MVPTSHDNSMWREPSYHSTTSTAHDTSPVSIFEAFMFAASIGATCRHVLAAGHGSRSKPSTMSSLSLPVHGLITTYWLPHGHLAQQSNHSAEYVPLPHHPALVCTILEQKPCILSIWSKQPMPCVALQLEQQLERRQAVAPCRLALSVSSFAACFGACQPFQG